MLKTKLKENYLCTVCRKTRFKQRSAFHTICSVECAIKDTQKAQEERKKKEKKEHKAKLKEVRQNRSWWLEKVQKACNKYIRLRDYHDNCISCGSNANHWEAGHYKSVGSSQSLRYDENNIHKQCHKCNHYESANLSGYRPNLIKKIGVIEVERLEGPQEHKYYRIPDLIELYKYFCNKIKQREKELENESYSMDQGSAGR